MEQPWSYVQVAYAWQWGASIGKIAKNLKLMSGMGLPSHLSKFERILTGPCIQKCTSSS